MWLRDGLPFIQVLYKGNNIALLSLSYKNIYKHLQNYIVSCATNIIKSSSQFHITLLHSIKCLQYKIAIVIKYQQ
jgi:hypothetical protein